MSNAPDDEHPKPDIADQLAGTPATDVETTQADAAAPGIAAADGADADGSAEPAPLAAPNASATEDSSGTAPAGYFEERGDRAPVGEPEPLVEPAPSAGLFDARTEPSSAEPVADPTATQAAYAHEPESKDASESTVAAEAAPLPQGVTPPATSEAPTPAAEAHAPASEAPAASAYPVSDPVVSSAPASPQTVYVTAPTPPKKRSNRGIGTLFAVLGTIAFGLLHSLITAIAYAAADRAFDIPRFLLSSGFLVPTITFLVVFVLAVLLINRAGWWAWVLGSLVVAAVTYFASIGIIMLLSNAVALTPAEGQEMFLRLAVSAPLVVAVAVAREVAIWFGLAIAARGRKVKARNAEARAAYDRELAESRTRYGATAG
ncbi:MAG: hypothetical protein IR160_08705 [Salinibacterium sp.]|nr:hypothetical protein [Salinibacterium sp.]MBF0672651.1 hypothetical protein [Salinibacterium sp.]